MQNRTKRKSGGRKSLESALSPVTPAAVRGRLAKTARIVFQLSEVEKREIAETASGFGMTTTEYMLSVHRLFRKLSGGKTPKSVVRRRTNLN